MYRQGEVWWGFFSCVCGRPVEVLFYGHTFLIADACRELLWDWESFDPPTTSAI